MAYAGSAARGRRWADIVAILASVVRFGHSVWGGMLAGDSEALSEECDIGLARVSVVAAGAPGLALLISGFFVGPMPDELEERG